MKRGKKKTMVLATVLGEKVASWLDRGLWRKEAFARAAGGHCKEYMKQLASRGAKATNARKKLAAMAKAA